MTQTSQKEPLPPVGVRIAPPYSWSSDTVLPDPVQQEIDRLLAIAASCHETGIEMRHVFVGIDADGQKYMVEGNTVPNVVLPSYVMMMADKTDSVALVMCTEGYGLPQHVAKTRETQRTHDRISDHPEHFEVLLVQVETQLGTWIGQARIVGEDSNRTVKDELVLTKASAVGGRYNNLLKCNWQLTPANTLANALSAQKYYAEQLKAEQADKQSD